MEKKAEKIKKLLLEIEKEMKALNIPNKVIEKKITNFGNSAHIVISKEYSNKKAVIIIKK